MVSCRSFRPRSFILSLLVTCLAITIPSVEAISVKLSPSPVPAASSASSQPPTSSAPVASPSGFAPSSTIQITWTIADGDPTEFSIDGQGFSPTLVQTNGETSGVVSMKIPEIAPGLYTISAHDPEHNTEYGSFDLTVIDPSNPLGTTHANGPIGQSTSPLPKSPPSTPNPSAPSDSTHTLDGTLTSQPEAAPQSTSPGSLESITVTAGRESPSQQDPSAHNASSSSPSSSGSLSTGPVVGIVLGILALLSVLGLCGAIWLKRRQRMSRNNRHFSFNRDMMVRTATPSTVGLGDAGGAGEVAEMQRKGWETFSHQKEDRYRDDIQVGAKF